MVHNEGVVIKASSGTPPVNRSASPLLTALGGPQCDVLFELSTAGLSRLSLGRILTGADAGRVVALRRLQGPASSELRSAAERAQSIAHPKLAKALGLLRIDGVFYFASEYIPGVTLFEVLRASLHRGQALSAPFAVRVVLDALRASDAALQLLGARVGESALRSLYPENIWIAEFGETFVSEVLVAGILAKSAIAPVSPLDDDVASAGSLLLSLISGVNDESSLDDPRMPPEVAEIAARALGLRVPRSFTSVAEFADALSGLDDASIASEAEVSGELASLMGAVLDIRRQKLAMTEREAVQDLNQDETKFFRTASVGGGSTGLDTARPPAGPASLPASAPRPAQNRPPEIDEPDEPTMFYRSAKLDTAQREPPPKVESSSLEPRTDSVLRALAEPPASPAAASPVGSVTGPIVDLPSSKRGRRKVAFVLLVLALSVFTATSGSSHARYTTTTHAAWVWLNGVSNRVLGWFRT